jgi:broad specificity phosphatase PhoE
LSTVYLVRHGQAGTRDDYDSLSELGRRQARLLGEYIAGQQMRFAAAYAGGMSRQLQTAEEVRRAYVQVGGTFPEIKVERQWNEFDLGFLYDKVAPRLCSSDPQFKIEYDRMREQVRTSGGTATAAIHRKWQPCDSMLVQAWIKGENAHGGETWEQFCSRIAGCRALIPDSDPQANVIVFTSATPVAIWTGLALEIFDERIMGLAGVLYNTSFTTLKLRGEGLRLFTFNAIPHLTSADLRTHR